MSRGEMSVISIETLAQDEGARLREVRLRSLRDTPDAFGSTWEEVSQRPLASFSDQLKTMKTLVAVMKTPEGSRDVGVVRGAPDNDGHNVRWLLSMWVAPEARRGGVGSALIEALIDWARDDGAEGLRLEVGAHNTGAIALYRKHGFRPTGISYTLPPPRSHITEIQFELKLISADTHGAQSHDPT